MVKETREQIRSGCVPAACSFSAAEREFIRDAIKAYRKNFGRMSDVPSVKWESLRGRVLDKLDAMEPVE